MHFLAKIYTNLMVIIPHTDFRSKIKINLQNKNFMKMLSRKCFKKDFSFFSQALYKNIECFIFGRRKTGYFDLRKLNGLKIHASAKAEDCILLETSKTFLTERRVGFSSNA